MSLRTLFCHDVTVVRAAVTVDVYGNTGKDWAAATRETLRGRVAQRTREEDYEGGERVVTEWVVYLPAGADVSSRDRIEWSDGVDDLTFEVRGRPHRAFDRHREHHVELLCHQVEG